MSSDYQLRRLVADGTLRRLRRGVYISNARWNKLSPDDRVLADLYARRMVRDLHLPVIGPSAAVLHGLFTLNTEDLL